MAKLRIGKSRLRAVIDTGAEISLFDNEVSEDVSEALEIDRRFFLSGVGGEPVEVVSGQLREMYLDGLKIRNSQFVMSSLKAMNKAYSKRVDAVLGFPVFSGYVMSINFVKAEMSFFKHE